MTDLPFDPLSLLAFVLRRLAALSPDDDQDAPEPLAYRAGDGSGACG